MAKLTEEKRAQIVEILNQTLADVVVLYVKTRNFHWNVEAPNFYELHKLFESQYETLDDNMDNIAERARALQGRAAGSLAEYLKIARLKEAKGKPDARKMLAELLADHEAVANQLRKDVETVGDLGDVSTEDFLTGLIEGHEKMAWMLRSSLR